MDSGVAFPIVPILLLLVGLVLLGVWIGLLVWAARKKSWVGVVLLLLPVLLCPCLGAALLLGRAGSAGGPVPAGAFEPHLAASDVADVVGTAAVDAGLIVMEKRFVGRGGGVSGLDVHVEVEGEHGRLQGWLENIERADPAIAIVSFEQDPAGADGRATMRVVVRRADDLPD